jgi:hypothetical protein
MAFQLVAAYFVFLDGGFTLSFPSLPSCSLPDSQRERLHALCQILKRRGRHGNPHGPNQLLAGLHSLDLMFGYDDQCELHYHQSASTNKVLDCCTPHLCKTSCVAAKCRGLKAIVTF